MMMLLDVAVVGDTQGALEVIIQLITSPLFRPDEEYSTSSAPTGLPLRSHWNEGVPPFSAVALKSTVVPAQIVVPDEPITKTGEAGALTFMVMALELAVAGEAQLALEVIMHVTTSPCAKALLL
jgi:membrane-associated protease RseP (regulator of RpoE activity)